MNKIQLLLTLSLYIITNLSFAVTATYTSTDTDWFSATHWSTGSLPDANTDVIITGNTQVIIDPALSPTGPVIINDLLISGHAKLTLLNGTHLQYNDLTLDESATFDSRGSELNGNNLLLNESANLLLNPTSNTNDALRITENNEKKPNITFHLGGTTPASRGDVGEGHYAAVIADIVELAGRLDIKSIDDFIPSPGDRFKIITANNNLTGTFASANEGDIVAKLGNIYLTISYERDDVMLTAIDNNTITFIGINDDWLTPSNWSSGIIPGQADQLVIPTGAPAITISDIVIDIGSLDINSDFTLSNAAIKLFAWRTANSFITLNPSYIDTHEMTISNQDTLSFGLAGNAPATLSDRGAGFYANIQTFNITLSGSLEISLFHQFQPQIGDEFKIITVNGERTGTFLNISEGDVVTTLNGINLILSYLGGDGNDIVLKATQKNVPGDANNDGILNILDIIFIINIINGNTNSGNSDCNKDNLINILDIICVTRVIISPNGKCGTDILKTNVNLDTALQIEIRDINFNSGEQYILPFHTSDKKTFYQIEYGEYITTIPRRTISVSKIQCDYDQNSVAFLSIGSAASFTLSANFNENSQLEENQLYYINIANIDIATNRTESTCDEDVRCGIVIKFSSQELP